MGLFPHASLVFGLILALASAAAFNWSWVAQHSITSRLPVLTIRHPWRSLGLLFGHRRWLFAFVVGIAGWAMYVGALRLAPLDLLAGERLGDEVEPAAAVRLGDHDPEQPELRHPLDHAQVEPMVDVVLDRDRQDPLLDERTYCVLDQPLLAGKLEVHVANLARWASSPTRISSSA